MTGEKDMLLSVSTVVVTTTSLNAASSFFSPSLSALLLQNPDNTIMYHAYQYYLSYCSLTPTFSLFPLFLHLGYTMKNNTKARGEGIEIGFSVDLLDSLYGDEQQ